MTAPVEFPKDKRGDCFMLLPSSVAALRVDLDMQYHDPSGAWAYMAVVAETVAGDIVVARFPFFGGWGSDDEEDARLEAEGFARDLGLRLVKS